MRFKKVLEHFTDDFEFFDNLSLGDQFREIHIRFRNMDDFGSYINAIEKR